jgi:superfamily II DNA or RNA helicase
MVAEGVDIPRLRVGVFATTTTTELFFRQAVGRLVRWTPGFPGQKSFLYIPDEPRLRARALSIAEQRRHSLRHEDRGLTERLTREEPAQEQCSLFAPISAVPLTDDGAPPWVVEGEVSPEPGADAALTIPLPPLPMAGRGGGAGGPGGGVDGRTRREQKEHLRRANSETGRHIARHTGLTHAGVNAELNRITGVKKISEATVEQLQRRLDKADAWLRQASGRRVG